MNRLGTLNDADEASAVSILTPLIERAPQVARRVAQRRPFASPAHLARSIREEIDALEESDLLTFFRAHPELAPADPVTMTAESQAEQGRLNLTTEDCEYRQRLAELNAEYRGKFGFPFITALVRHANMSSVVEEFESRLRSDRNDEIRRAVEQIAVVSASRVESVFGGDEGQTGKATDKDGHPA